MKRRASEHILSVLRIKPEGLTPRALGRLVYDCEDYGAVSAVYSTIQLLRKKGFVIELTGKFGERNRRYRLVEIMDLLSISRDMDLPSPRAAQPKNRKRGSK